MVHRVSVKVPPSALRMRGSPVRGDQRTIALSFGSLYLVLLFRGTDDTVCFNKHQKEQTQRPERFPRQVRRLITGWLVGEAEAKEFECTACCSRRRAPST
ncbi:hypothetical protein BDV29DRAFT_166607, partial [Aspergillus leporis]